VIDREDLAIELQALIAHIRNHLPDAVITTRFAHGDGDAVVVHAQIVGGSNPGIGVHASAPAGDGAAEIAENRAIERAMIAIGLPPIEMSGPRLHSVPDVAESSARLVRFPNKEPEKVDVSADGEEPEEISWTAFWKWARETGYQNKDAVEVAIGRTINDLTPAQVRKLLDANRS
jgi:hypothetical protein